MAWYNPFSWGGGPDEVDYSALEGLIGQIQRQGLGIADQIRNISFDVTAKDQEQYGASYGHMRDLVLRDLQAKLPAILGQASGQAGARGLAGSGIEQTMRTGVARGAQRDVADVLSQFGAQQAGIMSQMASQRGQNQLGQNQQLWQTILGAYSPNLNYQRGRVSAEEQRIQGEKNAFGGLVGGIVGSIVPGLGNIMGMGGGAPAGSYSVNSADYSSMNPLEWSGPHSRY